MISEFKFDLSPRQRTAVGFPDGSVGIHGGARRLETSPDFGAKLAEWLEGNGAKAEDATFHISAYGADDGTVAIELIAYPGPGGTVESKWSGSGAITLGGGIDVFRAILGAAGDKRDVKFLSRQSWPAGKVKGTKGVFKIAFVVDPAQLEFPVIEEAPATADDSDENV